MTGQGSTARRLPQRANPASIGAFGAFTAFGRGL